MHCLPLNRLKHAPLIGLGFQNEAGEEAAEHEEDSCDQRDEARDVVLVFQNLPVDPAHRHETEDESQ